MALMDILRRYLGTVPPRSKWEDDTPVGQTISGSVQSYVSTYSNAGVPINPLNAMESPSVYACVRLIASSIARLDWQVLRETPDGKMVEPNHPLVSLLNYEPNEDTSALVFRETLLQHVLLTGNGFAYINRDGAGRPTALELIRPDLISMYRDGDAQPFYEVYSGRWTGTDGNGRRRFRGADIFHIVGPSFDGLLGVPPIHLCRDLIGLEIICQEFVGRFYSNGAVPSGILKMPGRLSPEASKRLRESWHSTHGGSRNSGKTAILEDGMTYESIAANLKDSDLVEIRKFCREQIAAAFGVPAVRIGATDAQSYSSQESADQHFVKHTLSAYATRLEQEASRKLIPRGEPYCTRISFDSMLRADLSTRFSAYATAITAGILTPNEARAKEGLPAVVGGDEIRLPLNTAAPTAGGAVPAEPAAEAEPVPASVDIEPSEVPASVDIEPAEVPASVDIEPEEMQSEAAARAQLALAAIRPAVEAAYRRHANRLSDYLLRQRTQAKIDAWAPPMEDLEAELRDTVAGVGRLLGDEGRAVRVLGASMLRHASHLRRTVGSIRTLSDDLSGWNTLPGAAAAELLDLVRLEVLDLPILENRNCGTGAGGFQPGNDCGGGEGGSDEGKGKSGKSSGGKKGRLRDRIEGTDAEFQREVDRNAAKIDKLKASISSTKAKLAGLEKMRPTSAQVKAAADKVLSGASAKVKADMTKAISDRIKKAGDQILAEVQQEEETKAAARRQRVADLESKAAASRDRLQKLREEYKQRFGREP